MLKMPIYIRTKLLLPFLNAWETQYKRCRCVCQSQKVCPPATFKLWFFSLSLFFFLKFWNFFSISYFNLDWKWNLSKSRIMCLSFSITRSALRSGYCTVNQFDYQTSWSYKISSFLISFMFPKWPNPNSNSTKTSIFIYLIVFCSPCLSWKNGH